VEGVAGRIIDTFKRDDERASGVISVWKLKEICRRLGHDDQTITSVLNSYHDMCGSNCSGINYEEFVTWMFDALPREKDRQCGLTRSLTLSESLSKNMWDRVATNDWKGGSMTLATVAQEAATVAGEGVSLHSPVKKGISARAIARSFLRFSPALLHQCLYTGAVDGTKLDTPMVKRFHVALLLIDISGFTRMSVKLGAELTRKHTSKFFDHIIHCITHYGGDVLKFLGDALLVAWPAASPAGPEERSHIAAAAASCASEVMRTLDGYVISDELSLTLHGGLAIGDVYAFDVGNAQRREFLVGGSLLKEIGEMESEATSGQLIMSREIASLLPASARETQLASGNVRVDLSFKLGTEAEVRTMISDHLSMQFAHEACDAQKPLGDDNLICLPQRYEALLEAHVPPSCREYVRLDNLHQLGEMRHVTTLFLALDVLVSHLNAGNVLLVQQAFLVIIEAAKYTGGAIRQFVLDDKGCVVILAWGVPRAAWGHGQDATKAIQSAFHILHGLYDLLDVECALDNAAMGPHVGIAAGEVYVGLIGAVQRCEYAMVGPSVNLAARLMGKAKPWQVLVEESVRDNALQADSSWKFKSHPSVQAKGYDKDVAVFVPEEDALQKISTKKNLVDEFTELWACMELHVQMVGKVASVLAQGSDDGEALDFPLLALVNIVNTLKISTYADAKKAVGAL